MGANQLNDAFTSLEAANAIKHLKKNKATGINGMTSEHIQMLRIIWLLHL